MPKIKPVSRAQASEEQRRVGDPIFAIRGGEYGGPYGILLHNPQLAERADHYGAYLRAGASLPKRLSVLVIAMTARHWTAQFEWAAHHHQGLEHGLAAQTLEAIRTRRRPDFKNEDEAIVYDYVTQLYANKGMADEVHGRAVAAFGEVGVIAIVAIAGYYSSVALLCNAFDLEVRRKDPPLPLPD